MSGTFCGTVLKYWQEARVLLTVYCDTRDDPFLAHQKQFDLLTIAVVRLLIVWHVDGHLRQKSAYSQIRSSESHSFLHEIS